MKMTRQGYPIVTSDRTLYSYVIKRLLGSGGFGDVYEAVLYDLKLGVALKRFKVEPGSTAAGHESWSKESTTHDSLSHPNILQVFDAFEYDGFLFIATELATASLDHCTPPGGWAESEVMNAGIQIASALHYMHTASGDGPLIHRDVTPNNIFYFQANSLFKLGDFGIAKQLDGENDVAVTLIANWSFVAPELARDGFSVPQSDLFQLGLVLYYMAQGKSAIDLSMPVKKKKAAIVGGAAYTAANDAYFVSDELQQIIKKLLLRDLNKRYSSAEEVVRDLRAAHKKHQAM